VKRDWQPNNKFAPGPVGRTPGGTLAANLDFGTWEVFVLSKIGYGAAIEDVILQRFLSRYLPKQRPARDLP
jgi:hypothetical protein